jgi:D-amino-acid dehydrogenase
MTRGLLMLCKSEATLHEETQVAERACGLGIPAEVLTPAEAAALDPGVRMDVAGAVYFPKDCHLSPMKLMAALTRRVAEAGGRFIWSAEVTGWRTEAGRVRAAVTAGGEFPADAFVLAGGAWSPQTVRGLGLRLPMQAGKGYSVTLEKPRRLPEICSILTEARVAVTPMGGVLRFGGTMEIAGNDLTVNRHRVEGIFKSIPRYLPDFAPDDFRALPVWSGLRPCSPDGLPYVGRFGRYRNLIAATGHAMMGVSLAPVTGRLVSELLSDEPPSLDIALLSPDRFG